MAPPYRRWHTAPVPATTPLPLLTADCADCFALCCVALPFAASADFATDKPAGRPCANLRQDFRCGIHDDLRPAGFTGCTVYDCFGAGQRVSQRTFAGRDWRGDADTARAMFAAFPVVRHLHELLWYLAEALTLPPAEPLYADLRRAVAATDRLAAGTPEELRTLDLAAHRAEVNALLLRTSELVRAEAGGRGGERGRERNRGRGRGRSGTRARDHRGADLIGAQLKGADLRGANLRGTLLIAADLRSADLTRADLIGADLRDARLHGADLTGAFFLTQAQLNAAQGDAATRVPDTLTRPAHWPAG
ncbi:pentapeptide repeat-containing protein [Streptomyces sp. JH002]|uniref:pentapeptide repeat-containing protein n=1 Tax=Streptomyces sp. JH002 TaxID=2763259 RepID=UPI003D80602E